MPSLEVIKGRPKKLMGGFAILPPKESARSSDMPATKRLVFEGLRFRQVSEANVEISADQSPIAFLVAGSYVTHETHHFVYFYLDQKAILLFKSG
ncbi:hypothetical protein IFM89_030076 [Coptis chinensis]|uniref:Uncharacterized protein n=1 Tax=Coptis chinensis TaxID=261450 RepID=A0A835ISH6_9MAGN|nr:hypothetical protein IFM89_030076 [Coptis chinensis]